MLEQKKETQWIAILLGTQEEAQHILDGSYEEQGYLYTKLVVQSLSAPVKYSI